MTTPLRPLWLDADPGFDDWLTMLMLAVNPSIDWLGMSVVHGNAPLPTTLDNALRIRQHYGGIRGLQVPIHAGCSQSLSPITATAQSVLGIQGMRTTGAPLPALNTTQAQRLNRRDSTNGVEAMQAAIRSAHSPVTLVAIGPLTNIATALKDDPSIAQQIDEIVIMGGSVDAGNHTTAAEFNIYADAQAADIVFNAGIPIRMFGLNVCRQVLLTQAHVAAMQNIDPLLAGYLDAYQRIRSHDGSVPMPLYDPVVAAWLMDESLFEFAPARVDIELTGHFTYGMTVCDFKRKGNQPPNTQVAISARGEAVVEQVLASMTHNS
jgi:purine nucleosidase